MRKWTKHTKQLSLFFAMGVLASVFGIFAIHPIFRSFEYTNENYYTLTLNGVSKLFVEAKKPSVDITIEFEPAMQTRKYGWNANHALSILTNFENLLIYDTTNKPEEGDSQSPC